MTAFKNLIAVVAIGAADAQNGFGDRSALRYKHTTEFQPIVPKQLNAANSQNAPRAVRYRVGTGGDAPNMPEQLKAAQDRFSKRLKAGADQLQAMLQGSNAQPGPKLTKTNFVGSNANRNFVASKSKTIIEDVKDSYDMPDSYDEPSGYEVDSYDEDPKSNPGRGWGAWIPLALLPTVAIPWLYPPKDPCVTVSGAVGSANRSPFNDAYQGIEFTVYGSTCGPCNGGTTTQCAQSCASSLFDPSAGLQNPSPVSNLPWVGSWPTGYIAKTLTVTTPGAGGFVYTTCSSLSGLSTYSSTGTANIDTVLACALEESVEGVVKYEWSMCK